MSLPDDQGGVDLVNATVVYENHKRALDDVSLFIKSGEFVSVLGRNGSGKSTLLKAIAGECALSSGSVRIAGKDMTSSRQHQRALHIAYIHQQPGMGLCPGMTIEENCTVALLKSRTPSLWGWRREVRTKSISEAIDTLDLPLKDRKDDYVGELSGGEQQMVSLLVAYLQQASILLLDEHTAALDPNQRREVISVTRKFSSSPHVTTIMVTHSIKEALELSQHVLVLENGRVCKTLKGFFKWLATEGDIKNEFFT